jgi:hypothetical protein
LSGEEKSAGVSSRPAQLESSEILIPFAIGHVGILGLPFREREKILLGNLPLFSAVA